MRCYETLSGSIVDLVSIPFRSVLEAASVRWSAMQLDGVQCDAIRVKWCAKEAVRGLRAVRCGAMPHTCIGQCAASNQRPARQALPGCPATPGGGPPPLRSKYGTFGRLPEQLGAASPPRRCRRPRDDSPPNSLKSAWSHSSFHSIHQFAAKS